MLDRELVIDKPHAYARPVSPLLLENSIHTIAQLHRSGYRSSYLKDASAMLKGTGEEVLRVTSFLTCPGSNPKAEHGASGPAGRSYPPSKWFVDGRFAGCFSEAPHEAGQGGLPR